MTIPRRLTTYASLGLPVVLAVGIVIYLVTVAIPSLQIVARSIDDQRTAAAALRYQQQNIDELNSEIAPIEENEQALDDDTWTFNEEEAFFTFWDTLAEVNDLKLIGPEIGEAVPKPDTVIVRPTTVSLTGQLGNITKALQAIQDHHPLLAIHRVAYTSQTGTSVTVALDLKTVWK